MALKVKNVISDNSYSNKIAFGNSYAKVAGQWRNFTKGKANSVLPNTVEKYFKNATQKAALTVSSDDAIADFGERIPPLKVILTGNDAQQFKATPPAKLNEFFTKFFGGLYEFFDVSAKPVNADTFFKVIN